MEIKVMKDIVDGAKANRCVILRGSEHYDEFYSMSTKLFCLHALLTEKSVPYLDELLPSWIYAQRKSWETGASGA
jgi:hypothetical protein